MLTFSKSFTRPNDATPYASGDLVANNTAAGSVTPMQFTPTQQTTNTRDGIIRRARIKKSNVSVTNASFRIHLFTTLPTPTNGDNGVFVSNKAANYLGAVDVTVDRVFSDGAVGIGVPEKGSEIAYNLASGERLYGLLEARGAYTPVNNEVFIVELEVMT